MHVIHYLLAAMVLLLLVTLHGVQAGLGFWAIAGQLGIAALTLQGVVLAVVALLAWFPWAREADTGQGPTGEAAHGRVPDQRVILSR